MINSQFVAFAHQRLIERFIGNSSLMPPLSLRHFQLKTTPVAAQWVIDFYNELIPSEWKERVHEL